MKRTPFSRSEKRLVIGGSLAALLLGFGTLALWSAKNSGDTPPHAPMPTPNGFDLYVAAATALARANPPVDEINDTKKRSPQEAATLYTPARRGAFVASNFKTWNLMQQARAAQTQHPDTRANWTANLPYKVLRELARCKTIEAKHFKDQNRWDLALQSGLDTLEMGRDVEHGAPLIGSLVGIAIESIGAVSLGDVPPHLSVSQAKNGARRLEKIIRNGTSPAEVLREEKWTYLTMVKSNFGAKPNFSASLLLRPATAPIGPMMDANIAEIEKPFALQVVPPKPKVLFSVYVDILYDTPQRFGFNTARRETMENSLLLRLALRVYRMENGTYPTQLQQLAPQIIAKIPRDPFGRGEAFRYRKSGDSYALWSIGPDGKDDGGAAIPIKPGKKRVVITKESRGDAVTKP